MRELELQICLDACLQTIQDCEGVIRVCQDDPSCQDVVRLSRECADVCQLSVYLMLRKTDFPIRSCRICAEICLQCAEALSATADPLCRRSAESCRVCAELCMRLLANIAA
ncbi:MAG: four-helix bundle copper-binding protein [Candidatus Melainabacteria bacterium HGW-Melainabacteria-1]|nr:MAG: four-helix bundle copper-binding protein [Candidatus Melainabacteria bacterium HGW-Melainabacteria-1]